MISNFFGREMGSGSEGNSSLLASATADEILVAEILLSLRRMMSLSEFLSSSNWGRKRKRSCIDSALAATSSSLENRIEEEKPSPNTPLSFPPSEADEKKKPVNSLENPSKKGAKQKQKLLDMIDAQTERKEFLTGEIDKVKKNYDQLKAENSQLKAKKQKMMNSECRNISFPMPAKSPPSDDGVASGAPLGIDLNLPAEEEPLDVEVYRPLDLIDEVAERRTRCAEARRKRIGIIRTKSKRNSVLKFINCG